MRPLSLPERRLTSVPSNSDTPYVFFFSKGHAEFFREFWHDFAKNRTRGDMDVVLCLLSAGRCGYVFVGGRPEMPAT